MNPCVDPRFNLVVRGSAEFVEWLGAADNPNGKGWAVPGKGYGANIVKLLEQITAQAVPTPAPQPEPDDGYPEGVPAWQKEGLENLVERGIINSPEVWRPRMKEPITVGEILAIVSRI